MKSDNSKGKVIFSFDFEIGWGDVTNERWRARQHFGVFKEIRPVLAELLREMDVLELPVTFATVGAMFDDPEKRNLDHLPSSARAVVDSAVKEGSELTFDGRDLFDLVLGSKVKHDIACHSYSHVPFTYEGVNSAFIRQELKEFSSLLARFSRATDRFVFPENREGYYEELEAGGFRLARVGADNPHSTRFGYLASQLISLPPFSREFSSVGQLTMQTGSMLFNSGRGRDYRIPIVYRRAKRGVDHVVKNGGTLHLWAHPFNFAESGKLKLSLIRLLRYMAAQRDAGNLEISTM